MDLCPNMYFHSILYTDLLFLRTIGVAASNYPELMRKCHLINAPWLFNTVWWVIKGWLAAKTIEKISVLGSSYLPSLQTDFSLDDLPVEVGGRSQGATKTVEPFPFDLSEGGLLHTTYAEEGLKQEDVITTETDSSA